MIPANDLDTTGKVAADFSEIETSFEHDTYEARHERFLDAYKQLESVDDLQHG